MSHLFDYLAWRGDLSLGNAPLNAVDALLLSAIAYVPLHTVISTDVHAEPIRLCDASDAYFKAVGREPEGNNEKLFALAAQSARFSSLRLFAAQKVVDEAEGVQFCAYSALLPAQHLFVCFEGTDDTLVGWQEDLRMSYECPVPAQTRALSYLRAVAAANPLRRIFVAGHSKGGNLAMYAAVYAGEEVRTRIRRVFNNDGPGFCDNTLSTANYREMRDRIETYLPASSVVGVLLEHDSNFRIVQSDAKGLAQHNPHTWQVLGADFLYAAERTAFGKRTEAILDHLVNTLSPERKRLFTRTLFTVLEATDQKTLSGITQNKMKSLKSIMHSFSDLDPELRALLQETLLSLAQAGKEARKTKKATPFAVTSTEKSS